MDPSSWQIILLIVLIVLSGALSSAETAYTAVNRHKLRLLADEGNKQAILALKLVENPSKLISSLLIGNNIVNISASALATFIAIDNYGYGAATMATGLLTVVVIIFGEITPKSLATQYPEKISMTYARAVNILMIILTPLIVIFYSIASFIIKLFGGNINQDHPLITEEELKSMMDVGSEEGVFEDEEKEMLFNVFEFGDLQMDFIHP